MADTDISGLTNKLSRKNQDIVKAIRSGVSEKRRAVTSLRINFNNSKSELSNTKQSINRMNVQELNDKSIEIADRIKQATVLLETLLNLDSQDEAVGILQRTIRLMNSEYRYISNRLKGSITDYNNVNRGIVELSKRVRRPLSSPRPVMVNTSTITGLPITTYNKDTRYRPRGEATPKVSINRIGNFAVTRLSNPVVNTSSINSNSYTPPVFKPSQTVIRNESEHNEWRKSFFKNFEEDRNRNFKEVIKALKALKFSTLPVQGNNNNDIDLPDIPDKNEKESSGSKQGDGKNRTTDSRSRGLKTGLAVGGARRALEEASTNFVDMDGNPIKDEYGSNPLQYGLKKSREILESKPVESGFQNIRTKIRGYFGLSDDTQGTNVDKSVVVEPGKTEVKDATPLIDNKDIDVVKSEVILDERMLNDILKKLLGMGGGGSSNSSGGGSNAANGGSDRGSSANPNAGNNSGSPSSLAPSSSGNNNSGSEGNKTTQADTSQKGESKPSTQATPSVENKDDGNKKATVEQPTINDSMLKADKVNPINPEKDTPKAATPSDVTGGSTSTQKDSTSANPKFNSSQAPATVASVDKPSPTSAMPDTPSSDVKPNIPPSTNTSPPSTNTNPGDSVVSNNSASNSTPAIDPTKTTTGDIPKAEDDGGTAEVSLDELSTDDPQPADSPPPKEDVKPQKTSFNNNPLVSQASFNPSATSAMPSYMPNSVDSDFNSKKQEAWAQYQRDAAPRNDESLPDYMKRRETLGLSNGGASESEAQPSNNPYISQNSSNSITPNMDSSDSVITPNADSVGNTRVPYKPPMPRQSDPEPIEKSPVDTSAPSLGGDSSSTVDSTAASTNYGFSKQDTPKSIIRAENLGLVQIDGEYLT